MIARTKVRAICYLRNWNTNSSKMPGMPRKPTTSAVMKLISKTMPVRPLARFRSHRQMKPERELTASFQMSLTWDSSSLITKIAISTGTISARMFSMISSRNLTW